MDKVKTSVTRFICSVCYVNKRGNTGYRTVVVVADIDLTEGLPLHQTMIVGSLFVLLLEGNM